MVGIPSALAVVFLVYGYAHLKLVKWSLNTNEPAIRSAHVGELGSVLKLTVAALLVSKLGPDVGSAAIDGLSWTVDAIGRII